MNVATPTSRAAAGIPGADGDPPRTMAHTLSLSRVYARPMIDLGTIAGLHGRQHTLATACTAIGE